MSRTAAASFGYVWVWSDNDNPGAGTKGVTKQAGGTGLNSNWETFDLCMGTEHNANGTHKNDKITGANLNSNVVDGSTLEVSAGTGTKVIRIKDAGVTMAKIAQAGATAGQAITWSGSAWAPSTPIIALSSIPDNTITAIKFAQLTKAYHWIFQEYRVAGVAAGNTPAADLEWAETSTSFVVKIETFIDKTAASKKVRMSCELQSIAANTAYCQLYVGGSTVEVSTAATTFTFLSTSLDVSGLGPGYNTVQVLIRSSAGGSIKVRKVRLFYDPTTP